MKKKSDNFFKRFLRRLGPGFITGSVDDDPSGIATYSQTGAQFGNSQLWTASFSFPFMSAIQEMCGRIGIITGSGIAGVMKKNYPKIILYFSVLLLTIANVINIGVDLGAMTSSARLVFGINFNIMIILMATTSLLLQVFIPYKIYSRYLKYLTLSLLAYIIVVFFVKQDWGNVFFSTFIPHFSFTRDYFMNIVAILGTTISPYLFFWQAGEEVEEEIKNKEIKSFGAGKPKLKSDDIMNMRVDTIFGMFFSNLIMFFIMLTAASTLGLQGINDIQTADQAAEMLRPIAGDFVYILFALGIIGTGLLAVPILAGSVSYALAETFDMKEGLYKKFKDAHGFYGIIILSTIIGVILNFTHLSSFKMLYYAAVLNGLVAPPLMFMILLISNNKKIMGSNRNGIVSNILGGLITVIMAISAVLLLIYL